MVDLLNIALAEFEFEHFNVLIELALCTHSREYDVVLSHVPVKDNLSCTLLVFLGQIKNHRFLKQIEVLDFLEVAWRELDILAGGDWRIGRERDLQFSVEFLSLQLREVGVHFQAVQSGFDVAEGQELEEHDDGAVHDADALDELGVAQPLHLVPDLLDGHAIDHLGVLDDVGSHVVNQVQVDVVELQIRQGQAQRLLDVIAVGDPQLRHDVEVLPLAEALVHTLLQGEADGALVPVDGRGVEQAEAVTDAAPDYFRTFVLGEVERPQTEGRDVAAVAEGAHGDFRYLDVLLHVLVVLASFLLHHLLLLLLEVQVLLFK